MAATFARTLRSIETDGSRGRAVFLLVVAAILGLWLGWFLLGQVAVYEVTDRARLEVETAAHPLASHVGGRVTETRLQLGREVKAGEVLVALDDENERLALDEARALRAGLVTRLEALRRQIAAERKLPIVEETRATLASLAVRLERQQREIAAGQEAAAAHLRASAVAVEEAAARHAAAESRATFAERQLASLEPLRKKGVVSGEEYAAAKSEAESERKRADALRLAAAHLTELRRVEGADRRAEIAKLEREAAEIEGDIAVKKALVSRLEADARLRLLKLEREAVALEGEAAVQEAAIRRLASAVEVRRIRAPIDGRIGHAGELRVGSVVEAAQELASIVPSGRPRVVAHFPVAAVGRLQPGQPARLRLDGFPWTQYGTPRATVDEVGMEPTAGRVRVELTLDVESAPAVPLQHGLAGSLEVQVDRISPAEVVLRAVGRLLTKTPPGSAGLR